VGGDRDSLAGDKWGSPDDKTTSGACGPIREGDGAWACHREACGGDIAVSSGLIDAIREMSAWGLVASESTCQRRGGMDAAAARLSQTLTAPAFASRIDATSWQLPVASPLNAVPPAVGWRAHILSRLRWRWTRYGE
jgi:hypothetical protein